MHTIKRTFGGRKMEFVVVAMRFNGGHVFTDEEKVVLVPEPTNAYDPNAIAVMVAGSRVAYVARDYVGTITGYLERLGVTLDSRKLFFVAQFAASAKFLLK